ncbi:SDR family oxidoreductase [Microlunatus parietis]|uniref:NAD(P)-dependent dehydrogenase (Short-subunit alcohol dehydrogenase family) n=1 Tax=Microlunatus parietis TaxID=682979 RepID=A0A7Y9IC83_9ACTN|nr:SDR family oxidoreductase [Microlunatus parietis]NYE73928.1 NAD(P)-dependent dehydrogenase (short-subunit alcohol dehydrogenase family) [Microlunatus parietis]
MSESERPLTGRVALVTGATRGCGRAIAVELGALGATVYGTGRSTRAGRSPIDRPETIEDTAERVTAAGGDGIAVRCDHSDREQVAALVDRIRRDHGRLDILINDVWGGDSFVEEKPLWEHSLDATISVLRNGIETHLITNHYAIPLVLEGTGGLVIEVGDGKADVPYRGNVAYDLVKASVVRLGAALAHELRSHGVTALTVTPGWLRSEAMLDHYGITEETWQERAATLPYFDHSETPHLLARGIAALAADPDRARFAGTCLGSWDLMREYDLVDADGTRPDWGSVDTAARQVVLDSGMPA